VIGLLQIGGCAVNGRGQLALEAARPQIERERLDDPAQLWTACGRY
jgi:hypothetical protein